MHSEDTSLPELSANEIQITEKSIPQLYNPPFEELSNVSYWNTSNHVWKFINGASTWAEDAGSWQNFLTISLLNRIMNQDQSMMALANVAAVNTSRSIFSSLSISRPENYTMKTGFFDQTSAALYISRDGYKCFKLIDDFNREDAYFASCLRSPETCDYGISLSFWIRFENSVIYDVENLLMSGRGATQGYYVYLKKTKLFFKVVGEKFTWDCSVIFNKISGKWNNFGFTWNPNSNEMKIVINNIVIFKEFVSRMENSLTPDESELMSIGCHIMTDDNYLLEESLNEAYIMYPAIWYWPVNNEVLLTGGLDYFLKPLTTTEPPTTTKLVITPFVGLDYRNFLVEYNNVNSYPDYRHPKLKNADRYYGINHVESYSISPQALNVQIGSDRIFRKNFFNLTTDDSFIKLDTIPELEDIYTFSSSQWIYIPETTMPPSAKETILESVANFEVVLLGKYLHVLTYRPVMSAFRIMEPFPKSAWFNLGFTVTSPNLTTFSAYFNGVPVLAYELQAPLDFPLNQIRAGLATNDFILGCSIVNQTVDGVLISEPALWLRYLSKDDSYRFVGMTKYQQEQLRKADLFWTTSPFIRSDADAEIVMRKKYPSAFDKTGKNINGIAGYPLASIFVDKSNKFTYTELDPTGEFYVPSFNMMPRDFVMLSNNISDRVNLKSIDFANSCFQSPEIRECSGFGFTMNMAVKILSISKTNRYRYIFSSGNLANPNTFTYPNHPGIAIYTVGDLLGVSVSTRTNEWNILLDSKSYQIGEWMIVGFSWSEDNGLRLFINGNEISQQVPRKVFKASLAKQYVVMGRFNTDRIEDWISPTEKPEQPWEMANIAISDLSYLSREISFEEYIDLIDWTRVDNLNGPNEFYWNKRNLWSPPDKWTAEARRMALNLFPGVYSRNISLTETVSIKIDEKSRFLTISGNSQSLYGPFKPEVCPNNLTNCNDGIIMGGWYRIQDFSYGSDQNMTVLLSASRGRLGVTLSSNLNELTAWLELSNDTKFSCFTNQTRLGSRINRDKWFHILFSYNPKNQGSLRIYLNGLSIIESTQPLNTLSTEAQNAKSYTQTLQAGYHASIENYIAIANNPSLAINSSLSIGFLQMSLVTLESEKQLSKFMNLAENQFLEFKQSDFYWTFTGIFNRLNMHRYEYPANIGIIVDSFGLSKNGLCTTKLTNSYILLRGDSPLGQTGTTNLQSSCLFDASRCSSFSFSIQLLLYQDMLNNDTTILQTFPVNVDPDSKVGFSIVYAKNISGLQVRIQTLRSFCVNMLELGEGLLNVWFKLQVIWYNNSPPKILINDVLQTIQGSCYPKIADYYVYTFEIRYPFLYLGYNLKACFAEASTRSFSQSESFDVESLASKKCYGSTSSFDNLFGDVHNQNNELIAGTLSYVSAKNFTNGFDCVRQLHQDCYDEGFTLTFDIIESTTSSSQAETFLIIGSENDTFSGIHLSLQRVNSSKWNYNIQLSICSNINTWSLIAPTNMSLEYWTNLGFQWRDLTDKHDGSISLFVNGTTRFFSSTPEIVGVGCLTRPNPIENIFNRVSQSTNFLLKNMAYWDTMIGSCSNPRNRARILTGSCVEDNSITEKGLCVNFPGCKLATATICIDQTMNNVEFIAKNAQSLESLDDLGKVLKISSRLTNFTSPNNVSMFDISTMILERAQELSKDPKTFKDPNQIIENIITFTSQAIEAKWSKDIPENKTSSRILDNVSDAIKNVFIKGNLTEKKLITLNNIQADLRPLSGAEDMQFAMKPVHRIENEPESEAKLMIAVIKDVDPVASVNLGKKSLLDGSTVATVMHIKGIEKNDRRKIIFGGINSTNFDSNTLRENDTALVLPNGVKLDKNLFSKIPNEMAILSTGISVKVSNTSAYQISMNNSETWVNLTIPLVTPNVPEDVDIYNTQGRLLWKAIKTAENINKKANSSEVPKLALPMRCVSWNETENKWTSNGCYLIDANITHAVCSCVHMTIYAVGMEPFDAKDRLRPFWMQCGAPSYSIHKKIQFFILTVINIISLASLGIFIIIIVTKNKRAKYTTRYVIHLNFCLAAGIYHLGLLLNNFYDSLEIACRVIGVLWQVGIISISAWLVRECIFSFNVFVRGRINNSMMAHYIFGWITPMIFVIAMVVFGIFNTYGEDVMCLPLRNSPIMYVTLGLVAFNLLVSIIMGSLLMSNLDNPAYLNPHLVLSLESQIWQLWKIIGAQFMSFMLLVISLYSMQIITLYLYWGISSSTGFFIFIYFGVYDPDIQLYLLHCNPDRYDSKSELKHVAYMTGNPDCDQDYFVTKDDDKKNLIEEEQSEVQSFIFTTSNKEVKEGPDATDVEDENVEEEEQHFE